MIVKGKGKGRRNSNAGKVIAVIIIVGLLVIIFLWLKKKDREAGARVSPGKGKVSSFIPVIAGVKIDPAEPTSSDFIRALADLKEPGKVRAGFQYRWFVNGYAAAGAHEVLLPGKFYKKGDNIYCRVKAVSGKYKSEETESNKVVVGNSPPIVNLAPVGSFHVPGRFRYTIDASDPDGDPLTYRLVTPLDRGIKIDSETGEIVWDIEGAGVVRIVFEIRDSDGAVVESSFTLNLSTGSEVAH